MYFGLVLDLDLLFQFLSIETLSPLILDLKKQHPQKRMPYSKAVIYKIYNIDEPDKFYVGSTANSIWRRLYTHKTSSKKCKSFFYTEVNRLGWDKFKIEVIENFPCNNKQELFAEEERIRSETDAYYNSYRSMVPEEQRKQNYKIYKKNYYEENRDYINRHNKNYTKTHKEQLKEYRKNYREEHKEHIKEQSKKYREQQRRDKGTR